MKRVIVSVLCLALALAAQLAAQTGPPERQPGEGELTSVSFTPEARIDSSVLLSPAVSLAPAVCAPNTTTYCANGNRFQVTVIFSAPSLGITNAPAQAVPLTGDTGYFWFFSSSNVELVIKVVDGRTFNGFFWVFYGALSDVAYTITVTDTQTGAVRSYSNTAGSLASVADVTAFTGGSTCTYSLSPSVPQSFGAAGGTGSFSVLTQTGCSWTAVSNASFITITGGASGAGNGIVTFSVAANSSTSARSGSVTAGGQTYTVNQSGASGGSGNYDGSWSGPTSQGKTVNFNVSNSALTSFTLVFPLTGSCTQGSLGVIFNTPRAITGNTFSFSSTSSLGSLTANGTFTSNTTANGSATYTLNSTPPSYCSGSGSVTWTAGR